MIPLLTAIVVASLLGSMHCVGMCGPLALWASGMTPSGSAAGRSAATLRLVSYHAGRLLTYLTAGAVAGLVGAMVTSGGMWLGLQSLAARIVGIGMIVVAIDRLALRGLWRSLAVSRAASERLEESTVKASTVAASPVGGRWSHGFGWSQGISRWVAGRRPWIMAQPLVVRGIAAGALTTLLPCGWLYLFVLIAAGTGAVFSALAVMFAFWLGTLPALTALVLGALRLAPRMRSWLPVAGSLLLLVTGFYTATGRAAADLRPLAARAAAIRDSAAEPSSAAGLETSVRELTREPLPCCVDHVP